MTDMTDSLQTFTTLARQLVEAERAAELHSISNLKNVVGSPQLSQMRVRDTSAGVGGYLLLALEPMNGARLALTHAELSSGDFVQLTVLVTQGGLSNSTGTEARGTVWRITSETVVVSVDYDGLDATILDAKKISVRKRGNDVTFRRQLVALDDIQHLGLLHPIVHALFGGAVATDNPQLKSETARYLDSFHERGATASYWLNEYQKAAVCAAVASDNVALIHGPPGTGKTTTLAHAIGACVRVRGESVLACAPSNVAADTLVERIISVNPGLTCVRVGNPARILSSVVECTLDNLLHEEFSNVGRQIQRDISVTQKLIWRQSTSRSEREAARATLRNLRKELREREKTTSRFILGRANVIVTTFAGAADDKILQLCDRATSISGRRDTHSIFDVCFLDEAAQAVEPLAWCALLRARRCVIAGDDCQLPPTVLTEDEKLRETATELTAFSRAKKLLGPQERVHILRSQYRMHAVIGQFSSELFYDRGLIHDETVANHCLKDLTASRLPTESDSLAFPTDLTAAIIFIDTCGCDFYERQESDMGFEKKTAFQGQHGLLVERGSSYFNEGEAGVVRAHIENLLQAGVKAEEISVITPYAAQNRRIRRILEDGAFASVECGTVDSYQGRENEVVIFSATRSSELGGKNGIGFLGDARRFNVAVTRARRSFVLIGDSSTLSSGHPVLARFIEYVERRTLAEYRTAFSYS